MVSSLTLSLIVLIQLRGCMMQDKDSDTNHQATKGCYYKGRYHHGNWEDGCDHLCTCLNPHNGHYKCRRRCPRYKSLPQNCFLVLPPGGKCCKQPQCFNYNTKDNQRNYDLRMHRAFNSGHLKLKNVNISREHSWKETNKADLFQNRNPSIFENPNYITHKNYDNQSKLIRYTTPDNDDSIQSVGDTVTHTFFVTQKNNPISNDGSQHIDSSDTHIHVSHIPSSIKTGTNKGETFTLQDSTRQNVEMYSIYSENQFETSGNQNSNDSDGLQPDADIPASDITINKTNAHKLSEPSYNTTTETNPNTHMKTTQSNLIKYQKDGGKGDSQLIKNGNGKDDNDQSESDNMRIKENRLLNLIILNSRISSELKKWRTPNVNITSRRKEVIDNNQHDTTHKPKSIMLTTNQGEPHNKIIENPTSPTQSAHKPSYINQTKCEKKSNSKSASEIKTISKVVPKSAKPASEIKTISKVVPKSAVYGRTSVTFKPIIPLYANTSLKYKDKEWGKFVKELTHMFMEVNRLKEKKLKLKKGLKSTLMTTAQPKTNVYYDRPRGHFYGKGQVKPATNLKLKILDKEYITKKKAARPFRVRDCFHGHKRYTPGEKWRDQCNQTCTCSFDGRYSCDKERCLSKSDLSPGCRLMTHTLGCCPKLECTSIKAGRPRVTFNNRVNNLPNGTIYRPRQNVKYVRTSTGIIRLQRRVNGARDWVGTFVPNINNSPKAFCLYKNRKYITGEVWLDGCKSCRCINGMFGRYSCHVRCPAFANIPNNCSLHIVSQRQCCPIIKCNNRVVTTTLRNVIISPILQSYFDLQSRTTVSPFRVVNHVPGYKTNEKLVYNVKHHNGNRTKRIHNGYRTKREDNGNRTKREHNGNRAKREHNVNRANKEHNGNRAKREHNVNRTNKEHNGNRAKREHNVNRTNKEYNGNRAKQEHNGNRTKRDQFHRSCSKAASRNSPRGKR